MEIARFEGLCPNCGGEIGDDRLFLGLPCRKCLPEIPSGFRPELEWKIKVMEKLKKKGTLKSYGEFVEIFRKTEEVCEFFENLTGKKLWSAQKAWVKRFLRGYSFSISAPTGVGKTFFGTVLSLYLARTGKKTVFILPTTALVMQVFKNMREYVKKGKLNAKIVAYHSELSTKERRSAMENIQSGDFDILLITTQFLSKNYAKIGTKPDLIFVDDVDAIVKSSKNIEKLLMVAGFTPEILAKGMKIIELKLKLARKFQERIAEEIERIRGEVEEWKRKNRTAQIIIASATAKPKGKRVKLFRELLGFQIGGAGEGVRKIHDLYEFVDDYESKLVEYVKRLGGGGLIFVPKDMGREKAEEVAELLRSFGIEAEAFHAEKEKKILELFAQGKIDVLVGVAFHQGLLVRGLDMPARVRYAIFYELPRHVIRLEPGKVSPLSLLVIMGIIAEATGMKEVERKRNELRALLRTLEPEAYKAVVRAMEEGVELTGYLEVVRKKCEEELKSCIELLQDDEVRKRVESYSYAKLEVVNGKFVITYPDVDTYIQASGRTSRLYPGGVTTGLSLILTRERNLINGLKRQIRWRYEQCDLIEVGKVDLDEIVEEIDRDRARVKAVYAGELKAEFRDPIKSAMLIVESPNKARTIANFFGRPSVRKYGELAVYEVTTGDFVLNIVATRGHMFDLVPDRGIYGVERTGERFVPVYTTIKKCRRCGTQFVSADKCPKCGSDEIADSINVIKQLQEIAKEVDVVFLGADPDVEGEKIAWDSAGIVAGFSNEIKRMEFHEVSKPAIDRGVKNPREVDMNLVKAQVVRRIEDRWIGFGLSSRLWKRYRSTRLSAGRVQSVVLDWIVERFLEWKKGLHYYFRISTPAFNFIIDFPVKKRKEAEEIAREIEKSPVKVVRSEVEEREIKPLPPYTTDSMLSDATTLPGFSAPKVMQLAQDLFESGLITYHRTDSTRVSTAGIKVARDYLEEKCPEEFTPRTWHAEGAHECIRPVKPLDASQLVEMVREGVVRAKLTAEHIRLYSFIFNRFIASQMKPAKVQVAKVQVEVAGRKAEIEGLVGILKEGFARFYRRNLPRRISLSSRELPVKSVFFWLDSEKELYTQAEVIREMRTKRIGRPSTYAVIINKLFERGYVKEVKGKLIPTRLGITVSRFLKKNYGKFVSESRTAELYEKMEKVEKGEEDYQEVLRRTFQELEEIVGGLSKG